VIVRVFGDAAGRAAQSVVKALEGAADLAAALTAAQASADAITQPPEAKNAATAVAKAAKEAASITGATLQDVLAKARGVAGNQAPKPVSLDVTDKSSTGTLPLMASSRGTWGVSLRVRVDAEVNDQTAAQVGSKPEWLFNVTVSEDQAGGAVEVIRNVSVD